MKFLDDPRQGREELSSESGVAMIAAIIVLAVVTLLGVSLAYNAIVENTIVQNDETGTQAFYMAEAGLSHAVDIVLRRRNNNGFLNGFLAGVDGDRFQTADNGYLTGSLVPAGSTAIPVSGLAFGAGRYEVRVLDDDWENQYSQLNDYRWTFLLPTGVPLTDPRYGLAEDGLLYNDINNRVVIRSVGFGPNNTTATMEALVGMVTLPAVLTDGGIEISGSPTIIGTTGAVHTNSDLVISGSPTVDRTATSTGSLTISGTPVVAGGSTEGARPIEIPDMYPADYRADADYILAANGSVYNQAGTFIVDTSQGNTQWNGWKKGASTQNLWTLQANTTIDATLFVEGDARINANVGTTADPVNMTLIATGSIRVSGNPILTTDLPGVLFLAGTDIEIVGNANQSFEGVIYAWEQIKLSGTPAVSGNIIARDVANVSSLVQSNSISGDVQITSNRGLGTMPGVLSWREIKN